MSWEAAQPGLARRFSPPRVAGFTLVELMVALTGGLFVSLGGVFALARDSGPDFTNAKFARRERNRRRVARLSNACGPTSRGRAFLATPKYQPGSSGSA